MTIWESFGWDKYTDQKTGKRVSFYYDIRHRRILPDGAGALLAPENDLVIEIPKAYERQFRINPEKALKDLAGIPPTAEDPFISKPYKIDAAVERWKEAFPDLVPVNQSCVAPAVAEWVGTPEFTDSRKRSAHIDIGYSSEGDAAGIAVGHVSHLVESEDGDFRPYIRFDALIRVKAPPGGEVMLSDLRAYLYELKTRGMRIEKATLDGFQSTDTMQQLRKRRFRVDYLSMDKSKLPYEDLREAIYEDRIDWPPYLTNMSPGSSELVDIVSVELLGLSDDGRKIDHPKDGSKDLADAMAGVVTTLMGDKTYRKGLSSDTTSGESQKETKSLDDMLSVFDKAHNGGSGQSTWGVSLPPQVDSAPRGMIPQGIQIPDRLRPPR